MAFKNYKYEGDDVQIYIIRMSDSVKAAVSTNAEPAGDITSPFHVQASGSRKQFGIIPRSVTLTRTFGTAPDTGTKTRKIPILTGDVHESAALSPGSTVTISGVAWTVASRQPEEFN